MFFIKAIKKKIVFNETLRVLNILQKRQDKYVGILNTLETSTIQDKKTAEICCHDILVEIDEIKEIIHPSLPKSQIS